MDQQPKSDHHDSMQRIVLADLPEVNEILKIATRDHFNAWLLKLRAKILEHPNLFYNSEGVTENLLALANDPANNFDAICEYVFLANRSPIDWPTLAFKIREKAQS